MTEVDLKPANGNVVPLGRGGFFAVDRRAWAKACDLSMNAAVAYLVMARGTGLDMRTTSWSAKSMEERTSVPWRQCRMAVQAVVASGLVRQDKGGQHPRYTILPAIDVPSCIPGAQRPVLSEAESLLVDKIGVGRLWVSKVGGWNSEWASIGKRPHDLALDLARKGVLLDHGGQVFSVVPAPTDDRPDWIWLPNAITDGVAGAEIPVELIRQSANRAALRLFVDLYHAQSLSDFGGVHWRQLRQDFERHRLGERGSFVIWGFKLSNQTTWHDAPFVRSHLTGAMETFQTNGETKRRDTGMPVFWQALAVLTSTGLVDMVGHVVDSDTVEGAVVHPYGMATGEPGEQAIATAAHNAGLAMLNDAKRADATARGLWLLPLRKHMGDAQIVGLARLRYRARTSTTAAWMSDSAEWSEWVERYEAARGTALGIDVDINGRSTEHQREINGEADLSY